MAKIDTVTFFHLVTAVADYVAHQTYKSERSRPGGVELHLRNCAVKPPRILFMLRAEKGHTIFQQTVQFSGPPEMLVSLRCQPVNECPKPKESLREVDDPARTGQVLASPVDKKRAEQFVC